MMLRRMKVKTSIAGFTLIEVMIVIAIIAILAVVAIPNIVKARQEAQLSACGENLRTIGEAINTALVRMSDQQLIEKIFGSFSDEHIYDTPVECAQYLIDAGYLTTIPDCPTHYDIYCLTYYPRTSFRTVTGGMDSNGTIYFSGWSTDCAGGHNIGGKYLYPLYVVGNGLFYYKV